MLNIILKNMFLVKYSDSHAPVDVVFQGHLSQYEGGRKFRLIKSLYHFTFN